MLKQKVKMQSMSFEVFLQTLAPRPHIAEKIVRLLDVADVVQSLKTSKSLRELIASTVLSNPNLKAELDLQASSYMCVKGVWRESTLGPVPEPHTLHQLSRNSTFALDEWIISTKYMQNEQGQNVTFLYNSKANTRHDLDNHYRSAQILRSHRVLLSDGETVARLNLENDPTLTVTMDIRPTSRDGEASEWLWPDHDDSREVRYVLRKDPDALHVGLFDSHGCAPPHPLVVNRADNACGYIKQGNLVLIGCEKALIMYSLSEGRELWRVRRDNSSVLWRPLFLTESICGYVYDAGFGPPEELARDGGTKQFRLAVFEAKSGQKIDDVLCWEASLGDEVEDADGSSPLVHASGRHICVMGCSMIDDDESYDRIFCLKLAWNSASRTHRVEGSRVVDVKQLLAVNRHLNEPGDSEKTIFNLHPFGFTYKGGGFVGEMDMINIYQTGSSRSRALFVVDLEQLLDPPSQDDAGLLKAVIFPFPAEANPNLVYFFPMYGYTYSGEVVLRGVMGFKDAHVLVRSFEQELQISGL